MYADEDDTTGSPPTTAAALMPTPMDENLLQQYAKEMSEAAAISLADEDDELASPPQNEHTAMKCVRGPLVLDDADQDRRDAMHKLISLQTFSGAWLWDKQLRETLSTDESVLRLWQTYPDTSTAVKATALVIAYMTTNCGGQKEVWDLVVIKAVAWLAQETKLDADKVELVVQEAGKRLAEEVRYW